MNTVIHCLASILSVLAGTSSLNAGLSNAEVEPGAKTAIQELIKGRCHASEFSDTSYVVVQALANGHELKVFSATLKSQGKRVEAKLFHEKSNTHLSVDMRLVRGHCKSYEAHREVE